MKIPSKAAGICIIVCYAVTTSETFTFICHFTSVWICARSRNIHFSSGMQGVRCSLVILETKVLCLLLLHCHAWFSYWLGFPTGSTYIPCYLFQSVVFYFFFFFSKPCDLWNPSNSRKIDFVLSIRLWVKHAEGACLWILEDIHWENKVNKLWNLTFKRLKSLGQIPK